MAHLLHEMRLTGELRLLSADIKSQGGKSVVSIPTCT